MNPNELTEPATLSAVPTQDRYALFLSQTAHISWDELAPLFARGQVIEVAETLDLILVAVAMAEDHAAQVGQWMAQQQLGLLDVSTAKHWAATQPNLWAVVVNPWMLVQQRAPNDGCGPAQ